MCTIALLFTEWLTLDPAVIAAALQPWRHVRLTACVYAVDRFKKITVFRVTMHVRHVTRLLCRQISNFCRQLCEILHHFVTVSSLITLQGSALTHVR